MKKTKERKEMDKTKPKNDNVHKELEITMNIETGQREVYFNQQKYQSQTNQQHMQQYDCKI